MGRIAIVEGVRTPFIKAWTLFESLSAEELGSIAVRALIEKTRLDANLIDEVIIGTVSQPAEAANLARVISLEAGIPKRKRAYTVCRNCASGFESITSAYEKIKSGFDQVVIAGGVESMSNVPLLVGRDLSKILIHLGRTKSIAEKIKTMARIRPYHFKPVSALALGLTDPVSRLSMGQTAEVLAKEFQISRKEQDEFALKSHRHAVNGRSKLEEEIAQVEVSKLNLAVKQDNGPRQGQTLEALSRLRPYFDRENGTVTVGNSCQVTDGASIVLVMDEDRAKTLGYEPLGFIRAYDYQGLEPERMGLGPAYAIPAVLKKTGLSLKNIDLFEINEAFAAQVLACLKALASQKFAEEQFGFSEAIGEVPLDRLNVNGGAIALGHPVGVSGTRLVLTLLKEMKRRNVRLGLASLCVGGGQGGAILLER